MQVSDKTFEEMKKWLGDGEMDIEMMLRLGVMSRQNVIDICKTLIDSPWYHDKQENQHGRQSVESV